MRDVLVACFSNTEEASDAVRQLQAQGIHEDEMSLVLWEDGEFYYYFPNLASSQELAPPPQLASLYDCIDSMTCTYETAHILPNFNPKQFLPLFRRYLMNMGVPEVSAWHYGDCLTQGGVLLILTPEQYKTRSMMQTLWQYRLSEMQVLPFYNQSLPHTPFGVFQTPV